MKVYSKRKRQKTWRERKNRRERILHERAAERTFLSPTFATIQLKRLSKKVRSTRENCYSHEVSLLRRFLLGKRRRRRRERGGTSQSSSSSTSCPRRCRLTLTSSTATVCPPIGEQNTRVESYTIGTFLANAFLCFQYCNSFCDLFVPWIEENFLLRSSFFVSFFIYLRILTDES